MDFNKSKHFNFNFCAAIFLLSMCFASNVFANAGTPLMWMGLVRLAFANILIAIAEGLIISFLFRAYYPKVIKGTLKIIGIMILANYFSWFAGEIGILPFIGKIKGAILADNPLINAPKFILVMGIFAFVLTLILEWPFCLWVLRKKNNKWLKSSAACLLVNLCSYAFLVNMYKNASVYTIYTALSVQPNGSFSTSNNVWVYYIAAKDGDVHRIRPDGTSEEKIYESNIELKSIEPYPRPQLSVKPSGKEYHLDLWIANENEKRLLLENFALTAVTNDEKDNNPEGNDDCQSTNLEGVISNWIQEDEWIWNELIMVNKSNSQKLRFGLETPFLQWWPGEIIYLPNDQIVYQLGNQIVLVDLNKKLIGLLSLGFGPVVVAE